MSKQRAADSSRALSWPGQDNAVLARGFLDMKSEIQITLLHLRSWRQFHFALYNFMPRCRNGCPMSLIPGTFCTAVLLGLLRCLSCLVHGCDQLPQGEAAGFHEIVVVPHLAIGSVRYDLRMQAQCLTFHGAIGLDVAPRQLPSQQSTFPWVKPCDLLVGSCASCHKPPCA